METAEVDDRLVWIEERICSSLKGNGDEVKSLFSNDQNREVFLHFCNSGESRVLFVQLPSPDSEGLEDDEDPCVSLQPPKRIMEKAIMFIKCLHASKLSREEISNEVVVTECFKQPLNHLELITREVYLPLLARGVGEQSDKMLDMLHRLLSLLQTTRGNVEGDVVLPLPSIEVLAEVAGSQARTSIVVHVLESFVVTWMKLIKSILHKDPNVAVLKGETASSGGSRYPGPLVECHYWDHRLIMLVSLKDQISSAIVRNILRNLEQTQSSYASSFYSLQKDITKAIEDAEICIMFLNTLKPWIHQLHKSHDTDDIIRVFPPLLHVLQLIWRNCKYYNVMNNFNRLLLLLSNEVMIKSRDVVGPKVLSDPEMAYINLKTALRICASFRGCYLDYREKIEHFIKRTADKEKDYPSAGGLKMVPWPPRNASVFLQLNTFMERCNDVLELVVTIKHFNELEGAVSVDSDSKDPLLTDVNNKFIGCMEQFQKSTKDLLCFTDDDPFERSFFDFRTTILSLESSMSKVLMSTFDQCPNLMSELRVLEMFQGVSRREVVQASLKERCDAIVSSYTDELNSVAEMLTNHHRSPPQHKNMPPVTSKLCWLHALRERITWPMDKLREVAAELLEGDKGWSLRHIHGQLLQEIEQHKVETKSSWELSIPTGLHHRLKDHVMIRDDGNQLLGVNLDPSLLEVMREAHYLQHEPFNMKMPTEVKMLMRNMSEQTLHDSATKLQLVVQHYNSITQQLTDTTRLLFHNKLELTEELISHGLEEITWRSSKLQDFVADSTALISSDLHHVMNSVLERMAKIDSIIDTWTHLGGMTVFDDESGKGVPLEELQKKHEEMCDCVEAILVPSGDRIKDLVDEIFQVVEVSHDSPSWHSFLDHIDHIILTGLRSTILSALKILSDRVAQYEQGQAIPCLVKVKLGLVGSTISFTPPLDQQSALESVPEVVRRWMDDYVAMAKVMRPFSASTCETRKGCYYSLINKDPEVTATVAKICAHLETSARQCQALKRKFSEITFLWEQDVKSTFDEFLHGTFLPRPRCMSRPETVKTRPSSTQPRPKTSRSYSHSLMGSMSHKLGASMSAMMGLTDYGFLYASGSVRLMSTMRVRSRHSGMGDGDEDVKRPSIDDFDSEISIFKGIHDQIDGLDDFVSVGWIGVNMKPAKHLVCALITKWIYVYTNFLTKQMHAEHKIHGENKMHAGSTANNQPKQPAIKRKRKLLVSRTDESTPDISTETPENKENITPSKPKKLKAKTTSKEPKARTKSSETFKGKDKKLKPKGKIICAGRGGAEEDYKDTEKEVIGTSKQIIADNDSLSDISLDNLHQSTYWDDLKEDNYGDELEFQDITSLKKTIADLKSRVASLEEGNEKLSYATSPSYVESTTTMSPSHAISMTTMSTSYGTSPSYAVPPSHTASPSCTISPSSFLSSEKPPAKTIVALDSLGKFLEETEPVVEHLSYNDHTMESLMRLMKVFNKVGSQQKVMDYKFGAIHRSQSILEKYGYPLSHDRVQFFHHVPQRWNTLKKKVSLAKQRVSPHVQSHAEIVMEELERFGKQCVDLHEEFLVSPCLDYDCTDKEAEPLITKYSTTVKGLKTTAQDLIELQDLLEETVFNFSHLSEFVDELLVLQAVRDLRANIEESHNEWLKVKWKEIINIASLKVLSELNLEQIQSLPEFTLDWDIRQRLEQSVTEIVSCLPLIKVLSSAAMRPRHWKQVLRLCARSVSHLSLNPASFVDMDFKQFIDLGLQGHVPEVEAIAARAERDVKVESAIKNFEEVWLSKLFDLTDYQRSYPTTRTETRHSCVPHTRSSRTQSIVAATATIPHRHGSRAHLLASIFQTSATSMSNSINDLINSPIPMLTKTNRIFDALEDHQVVLQVMLNSSSAGSFAGELDKWHKYFQTIEEVLEVWLEVQDLWFELEEAYTMTEVQQSLPHQAYQFALIDKQWRELMFNTSRNPNVMQLCCKADLLPSLEKMQVSLQHCSVALMHYLENRKTKFPWYYFLPLDDILNIVCHGSKPAYISSYIHKLLPSCASLTYQEQGGLITGKLLMLHSHTGEKLKLDQPVTCEGTIEVVLSNFMTAISVTIKQSLSSLVKQYIPQAPTLGSEMIDVLHIVWQQPTATQLLLIVSQLLLHNALVQSINNLTSSDQASSYEMNDAYTFFSQAIDLFSDVLRQPDRLQAWVKPEESQSGESCDRIQIPLVFDDTTLHGNSNVPESNDTPIQKYDSSHSQKYIALSVRNLIIILGYYRDVVERLISSKLLPIPSIIINSSSEGGIEPNMENSKDFHLNSIIHYSWSDDDDGVLKLDGAGCSLEYGNQFVGGGQRLILSTDTERHMFYLLKVVTDMKKFALCIGEKLSARESTLNEMSSLSGREVHVLHCSEHSTHQVLCDYVRGMAATGSWIHLHHLEQVSRSILAVVGNMLDDVITAYSAKQSIAEHHHETLTLSGHFMCFSSLTTHTTIHTTLPEQILKVFHQVNFLAPQLIPILDGLLVSEGFKNSGHLTKHLLAMVNVFERLVLSSQHNVLGKSSLRLVKKLVSIASKLFGDLQNMKLPIIKVVDSKAQMKSHSDMYIQYKTGSVEKADASGPIGRTLGNVIEEDDSLLSLISSQGSFTGHVITSNVNSSGRESELDEIHYRTLEEFSLVLAAKECLFPYFELEGLEVNLFIQFITERFPGCDLYTLLAEERSMQESLLAGNPQHSAANSVNQKSARGRAMLHTGEHLDSNDVRGFDDSMISSCRHRNLTPSIAFQTRIAQFIQLLQENRMVVLQGESGCGKSTLINVCSDVMSSMGHNIHLKHINCNAMRPGELLGYFCDTDHEWQEGLLPQLLTQFSMHTLHAGGHRPTMEWIVLDGSLNARQIDNLTTILSEDGTLKLADKKSIYLPSTIKLVIETDEFLGVNIPSVHMTSRDISWESMVDGWLHTSGAKLVTSYEEILKLLFHKYVPVLLNFMDEVQDVEEMDNEAKQQHQHHLKQIKHATHHMRPSNIHLVNHICIILQASLPTVRGELNDEIMERHFLYAAVWAFGGHLSPSHQILFDYWLRSKCRKQLDEELPIPEAGNVFDYYVCPETQEFKCWADDAATRTTHLASHDLQKGFPHVHWNYSAAVSYLLGLLLQQGSSVLITGTTGNGKTVLVKDKLLELCSTTDYTSLHIYTNNTTSTETVWEQLSDSLQWKSGSTYIPKGGHHLICFVDDLHEAKSRDDGNCPIGELMRHHITMGNIYHPSTARAHEIPNLSFVVSCDKSYHLNNRILQHFIVLHLPEPNEESLVHTFGVILKNHFINTDRGRPVSSCQRITAEVIDKLVPLAIELHEQIPLLYLKTPKRLHYIFSIRDLVHVFWRIKMSLNSSHTTEQLLRHWHYETYWAYGAQLSSCVDRERYLELVRAFSKKYFGDTTLLPVLLEQEDMAFMPINMSTDDDDHLQSIMDDTIANKLRSYFNAHLAEYNKHNPPVSVNLYRSTLKETAHMIHVLQGPFDQGHILLIGHSDPVPFLVLSAQCCGYSLVHMSDVFSTKLLAKNSSNLDGMSAKSYRSPQFKEDLKTLFLRAGVKGEKILLVLNDTELLHLDFLTHAYEFLNDCAISYLFTAEEQAHINNSVRSDMNQAGIHFTSASAWNFFLKNICHNMRVVVTSASCDAKFQRNFKSYVSLCNRLNTVYCLEWSRMELVDVAIHHLRDHHMFSGGLQENLAHLLASIHLSVLQVTTNKHIQHPHVNNELYEYFVERFCHTVQRQHAHNKEMSDELSRALDRISSTRKEASKLGDQLGRETNTLDERKYASSKLLTQIGQDVTITSEHAKLINKQRKRIKHLQKVLPDYEHAYELVLADTDKMLQSTKSLVREMGQEQLTELRAISKPSQDIEDIFATIIMIVKSPQADISWTKGAKRLMANLDRFQEMLESFDQQDVSSESLLASLEHYTIKTSFTPDYLSQKYTNKAVTLLCRWVQGVMSYHSNLQTKVRPLQAKVTSMKNSLTENISRLKVMEEKYEILDERLIGLHKAFEQASVQKSTQLEKVNGMKKQLSNLEEFQATLSGIHEHWIEQLSNYQSAHIDYIGSDALSTALAVYLGPLSPELRLEFIDHHWSKCLKERGIELNWSSTEKVLIPSVTDEVGQSVFSLDHGESPAAPPTAGESPAAPPTTGESPAVPLTTGKSPVATPTTDDNNDTDVTNDDKMDDGKEVMDKSHLSTNSSESTGTSYLDLCSLVSSTLTERNLLEHWSAMGYDAYFILDLAIFQSSWGRWPLGFDPEGMMSAYVKLKHEKDDLLFLDYRNRSPSFFLSLEHAILHGQPVMMHHVDTMRFDPSLITLLDCNNTSSAGERVIRYCSRKMHSHPSFRLYLSTTSYPVQVAPSLAALVTLTDFTPKHQSLCSTLLQAAYSVIWPEDPVLELSQEVVKLKMEIAHIDANLLKVIGDSDVKDIILFGAGKIKNLVEINQQAASTIDSLMVKIRAHNDQIRSLTPLTDHAAHIFTLLQYVGPRFQFHLSEFLALFKVDVALYSAKLRECLADHHENDDTATQDDVAGEGKAGEGMVEGGMAGQEDNVTVVQKDNVVKSISTQKAIDDQLEKVLKTLNHTILEKASRSLSQDAWLSLALSMEELPSDKVGQLREKYGDITVPSLEQIIDEMMSSKSVQPRILIGEITGQRHITETTRQLMTRLLTAHQSDRTVTVIDVNAEQEADAKEVLKHPTTNCICFTNIELASHNLLQLVEHREEPLQANGCLLILCTSSLTGLSDSLLKTAQVIMLANLGKKINIPASDEERHQAAQHLAVHHEIRVVSSSSSGLSEASSQPEGLMQSLSFCKEYTPPTVECPQLDDFLSMLTTSVAVLSSINIDDATLAGDAGKAVMGYALYQDIEKYNELIEKIIEETDKLSSSVIGGMANVPDTLLASVQALEDGDTPDSWLLDDEPKKLSDYFKDLQHQFDNLQDVITNIS